MRIKFYQTVLIGCLLTSVVAAEDLAFSVTVDFGQDKGQSFGSLFEARDASGRLVAGAGFQDVYNTRFRNDRHTLQFFVRPDGQPATPVIERLPHPDLGCGIYLFDLDSRIYAWTSAGGNRVKRWDPQAAAWKSEMPPDMTALRSGDGVVRVGAGQLRFANDAAWYNDRQILEPPETGGYYNYYYAQGHLLFYHRVPGETGSTRLYACPWTSDRQSPVDVAKAAVLETPFPAETPFAWGQWKNQVVTVSNMGGIYVFEEGGWTMILEPDAATSYQVYSAVRWHDRLMLAQYPTGNIFAYSGEDAQRLENWPPVLPGVSRSARECQTLSLYGGDLWAGVWPWAEVWRRDHDRETWYSHGRLFTHPELTRQFQHPYELVAAKQKLVANYWGQRVTSMVPHGESLYLSTSSKGTVGWKDEYDFLTDSKRREYGSVVRLTLPGNLSAQMHWQDRPVRFDFVIRHGRLSVLQDGRHLAACRMPRETQIRRDDLMVAWGQGAFGPLRGILTDNTVREID